MQKAIFCIFALTTLLFSRSFSQEWEFGHIDTSDANKSSSIIQIDSDNIPHILYTTDYSLIHSLDSGDEWISDTTGINAVVDDFKIDSFGNIHASGTNWLSDKVLYYRLSSEGAVTDTVYVSDGRIIDTDLILDDSNNPAIVFEQYTLEAELYYATRIYQYWNVLQIAALPYYSGYVRILKGGDTTYITALTTGPPGAISFLSRPNSDDWQMDIIDEGGIRDPFGFAIDNSEAAYIAYTKDLPGHRYSLNFLENTSDVWVSYALDSTGIMSGSRVGVVSNSDSVVSVVYAMRSRTTYGLYLKHAYKYQGEWHFEVIDSSYQGLGYSGGIDLDQDDGINIVYKRDENSARKLIYARRPSPSETGAKTDDVLPRKRNCIQQIYPNPFNSSFRLLFALSNSDHIKIDLYDLQGRLVQNVYDAMIDDYRKDHQIEVDMNFHCNLGSGVYFVKLRGRNHYDIRKITYMK